ncbi:class I SAM-dependent methyltransferase [Pedobacter alpinus]|uniref:Class I SAM-dependent methyltransferase n=1 Tax=Pedobacter alpinus TaxID=1590643 RepID=A0ABW5TXI6_9SPHI
MWLPTLLRKRPTAIRFNPKNFTYLPNDKYLLYDSSWRGLDGIIPDIISQFNVPTNKCLEFGVEYGFSTTVFANYFKQVIGVDIFTGDHQAGLHEDNYTEMQEKVKPWGNINLIKMDYKDYIKNNDEVFDLIHVDIIHEYEETFECGLWAAQHSKVAIFHDTKSYKKVKHAVQDIATATGKTFYNYPNNYGLGILV